MKEATPAPLTLALSKGRIFEETMPLLAEAGIDVPENPESSRKLILPTSDPGLRLIIVRASDVPTYVQYGAADLGIAGKDVLIEHAKEQPGGLYQPIDLNIAKCRLAVAVRNGFDYDAAVHQGARLRVATKYVQSAREHFAAKGVYVDIIKLYGSMELAPLVGLADCIVDLVSTGGTLRANDLVAVEDVMPISSRLIVNQAALKTRGDGPVTGFQIAGPDGKYVPATAKIDGATVLVSSPEIPNPHSVRYAWDYDPGANLTNALGLPASLFRTDENDDRVR